MFIPDSNAIKIKSPLVYGRRRQIGDGEEGDEKRDMFTGIKVVWKKRFYGIFYSRHFNAKISYY